MNFSPQMKNYRAAQPLTRQAFLESLERRALKELGIASWPYRSTGVEPTAEQVADLIRALSLDAVIGPSHDGRATTYARGFELIYGERLTLKETGR